MNDHPDSVKRLVELWKQYAPSYYELRRIAEASDIPDMVDKLTELIDAGEAMMAFYEHAEPEP